MEKVKIINKNKNNSSLEGLTKVISLTRETESCKRQTSSFFKLGNANFTACDRDVHGGKIHPR